MTGYCRTCDVSFTTLDGWAAHQHRVERGPWVEPKAAPTADSRVHIGSSGGLFDRSGFMDDVLAVLADTGMTRVELAALAGLNEGSLKRAFNRDALGLNMAAAIAFALGLTLDDYVTRRTA